VLEVIEKRSGYFIVKLQFRKRSNLKVICDAAELVSWTIPRSGGYNIPQLAAGSVSKACFEVYTRD